jgi:hypothetical protein
MLANNDLEEDAEANDHVITEVLRISLEGVGKI